MADVDVSVVSHRKAPVLINKQGTDKGVPTIENKSKQEVEKTLNTSTNKQSEGLNMKLFTSIAGLIVLVSLVIFFLILEILMFLLKLRKCKKNKKFQKISPK